MTLVRMKRILAVQSGLVRHIKDGLMIYTFGSNLAGRHGAGSALFARNCYGAVYGVGEGLTGRSYALPTKDAQLKSLSIEQIGERVDRFFQFAKAHKEMQFMLSNFGTGLAGFDADSMLALVSRPDKPSNVHLSGLWRQMIDREVNHVYVGSTEGRAQGAKKIKSLGQYLDSKNYLASKTVLVWDSHEPLAQDLESLALARGVRGVCFEPNKQRFGVQALHCAVLSACWYATELLLLSAQPSVRLGKLRTVASQLNTPVSEIDLIKPQ